MQSPCNSRTLVVYDFDWSLINENCDLYVFKKLAPELVGRPHELYRLNQANDWAYAMHEAMDELFRHGFKKEHIKAAFSDVPLHSSMIKALHLLAEHGCELIIVSGANVIFIDHILEVRTHSHYLLESCNVRSSGIQREALLSQCLCAPCRVRFARSPSHYSLP